MLLYILISQYITALQAIIFQKIWICDKKTPDVFSGENFYEKLYSIYRQSIRLPEDPEAVSIQILYCISEHSRYLPQRESAVLSHGRVFFRKNRAASYLASDPAVLLVL